jgi:hypothetical protein
MYLATQKKIQDEQHVLLIVLGFAFDLELNSHRV